MFTTFLVDYVTTVTDPDRALRFDADLYMKPAFYFYADPYPVFY